MRKTGTILKGLWHLAWTSPPRSLILLSLPFLFPIAITVFFNTFFGSTFGELQPVGLSFNIFAAIVIAFISSVFSIIVLHLVVKYVAALMVLFSSTLVKILDRKRVWSFRLVTPTKVNRTGEVILTIRIFLITLLIAFLFTPDIFTYSFNIYLDVIVASLDVTNALWAVTDSYTSSYYNYSERGGTESVIINNTSSNSVNHTVPKHTITMNDFATMVTKIVKGEAFYPAVSVHFTHLLQILLIVIPSTATILFSLDCVKRCGLQLMNIEEGTVTPLSEHINKFLIIGDGGSLVEATHGFYFHFIESTNEFIQNTIDWARRSSLSDPKSAADFIEKMSSNLGLQRANDFVLAVMTVILAYVVIIRGCFGSNSSNNNAKQLNGWIRDHPNLTVGKLAHEGKST